MWLNRERRQQISESFERVAGLHGVVGAISGTFIRIKTPREHPRSYTCRKRFAAITLQGMSDNNLMFLDCFTEYPGSVADIRVFQLSNIFRQLTIN